MKDRALPCISLKWDEKQLPSRKELNLEKNTEAKK